MRLPLTRFLLADSIYALPGVTILFTLAYWFTNQVKEAVLNFTHRIDSFRPYLIIGGITAVALFLLYEFWKRRHVTGDPKEVPIIGEKVIKPAAADPFPDSVVLRKDQLQKPTVQKSAKKSGVNRLMLIAVIAAVGLYAAYAVYPPYQDGARSQMKAL